MGKNDFSTPKAIANRIKAKGLQKLRWYCQMCQKQCRDENGFKCHCMSESHQRQMEIFGQNPNRIVSGYSEEFEILFLEHMKRSHALYIADRHHVHMNSTQWPTLTEFVKYLGRTGKCKVEETPKGWFITYIDRDSETLFKEKMKNKRIRADLADEEKQEREIKKLRERAEQLMGAGNKSETDQKIKLTLGSTSKSVAKERAESSAFVFDEIDDWVNSSKDSEKDGKNGKGGGRSMMDELVREEEQEKERINRKDYWLCVEIIVKVMSKALADKGYYKQKGVIRKVIDKYIGEIEMLENKHVLRVDQEELETVIPQIGGFVKIVNGAYHGANGRLSAINTRNFCAKVQIERGVYDGKILKAIDYEDISKIAQ
ncbi:unnamed protein product [Withania somnifera]